VNAFADLAERQISAPVKARHRAVEKRAAAREKANQALEERDQLFAMWRRWRRDRVEALLSGPHGEAVGELTAFLKGMTLEQAPELITLVERGPWRQADTDTRFEILGLIDAAIVRLRERNDLDPFDDALPGEPLTAFQVIREVLR
jgi:hypothetical protein